MRNIFIFVFSVFLASTSYADTLQKALDDARVKNDTSAMQMTILMPGKEPLNVVSGKTMKKKTAPAITSDTLFQIGSDTKSFTSALILKLSLEGKLKLSDKVTQYFPEYKLWSNVSISQLLHNNSGIPSYTKTKQFQEKVFKTPEYVWTAPELLGVVAKKKLEFKPGHGWDYSNTNFILAGMIAEKITKKPLQNLYEEYFFDKLNLQNTYYSINTYPIEILNRMAHGYSDKNRDVTADNLSWGASAGAIVSNTTDLAKWAYALFHGKVVPESALKEMMSPVSTKTGLTVNSSHEGYGMAVGTRINKQYGKWWGHEGTTIGYRAIFVWYPEYDITIAILANGQAPHLLDFATSVPGLVGIKEKK